MQGSASATSLRAADNKLVCWPLGYLRKARYLQACQCNAEFTDDAHAGTSSGTNTDASPLPSRTREGTLLVKSMIVDPSDTCVMVPTSTCYPITKIGLPHLLHEKATGLMQDSGRTYRLARCAGMDTMRAMRPTQPGQLGTAGPDESQRHTRMPQSTTKSRPHPANMSIITAPSANSSSPSFSTCTLVLSNGLSRRCRTSCSMTNPPEHGL